ncbi:E3 SUMO-protein ligase ZNF451 isoform X2 [Tiliqua scincoides]|uniref:E3 SUMO-protein ligase ZNF451 isoform X2 n=1 Tax=Tiliqua scincoides TaxID=71010 RepID=UPI003462C8F4
MEYRVSPKKVENTSSQQEESEDDVVFVGEGVLRPVLDCIEISSSDEECSSSLNNVKRKDHIDYQKARVASTLDRLAHHVEVEKQLKEEKNKAFKEKLDSQTAHGLQELEFIQGRSDTEAARLCVNQWLKMPGLTPGTVNSGRKPLPQRSNQAPSNSKSILCPIMHCNRKFDNGPLLLGHLQRFDHSPCDPTITLHGSPASAFACIVCTRRFPTPEQYNDHCHSKASEDDGHERNYPPQRIQCFACPCCFLLFSIRDECLQHMSREKHFFHTFKLSDKQICPVPLPFPTYAKNLLISLCKEVPFQVKCSSCHRVLRSHVELTAHFRTHCRKSGPVAVSKKSISCVAEIFKAKGCCFRCDKLFADKAQISQHIHQTQHKVKVFVTLEESILMFCHISEGNKSVSHLQKHVSLLKSSPLKRSLDSEVSVNTTETVAKRKKDLEGKSQEVSCALVVKTWICECHSTFSSEELVEQHIISANRICHKCGVCGKLAENASIIRLHMSRIHGGAHLANFHFWCQTCSVALQKGEEVMGHVTAYHAGHTYYSEKDISVDEPVLASGTLCGNSLEQKDRSPSPMETSPPLSPMDLSEEPSHQWQCSMCEEIFDSEDSVKEHCQSLEKHPFHRYSCGLCKMTFRKIETLNRHCEDKHKNIVQIKYFCGFCGDLFFDAEEEVFLHFKGFHSLDYTCVSARANTSIKNFETVEESNFLNCGCREKYISKENRKADYRKCQEAMLRKGSLWYRCTLCSSTAQSLCDMMGHLDSHTDKKMNEESYVVRCGACNKSYGNLSLGHRHFHDKHCFSVKPQLTFGSQAENGVFQFCASGSCTDKKPDKPELSGDLPPVSSALVSLKKPENTDKEQVKKPHSEVFAQDDGDLPDLDYLCTMTHIIMMDLDNWGNFFQQLPATLNQGTFIWGFQGGHGNWKPPVNCKIFNYLNKIGCFFLHPRCGTRREAADFAICVHVGRLDEHLPKHIPFTILSGDKSFLELESQLKMTQRTTRILDPHKIDADVMCALLNNISDTAKDEGVEFQEGNREKS